MKKVIITAVFMSVCVVLFSQNTAQMNIPNLKDSWSQSFETGTAITANDIENESQHYQLFTKHFTMLVAENEHTMKALQPQEGVFNWEKADAIVNYAVDNAIRLRWHTLLCNDQNPDWVFQDRRNPNRRASRDLLNERLRTHIQEVGIRYRGIIDCYDVVRNVLADSGGDRNGLRTGAQGSQWHRILGPEYIDNAFRWINEVDPGAQLAISDYNLESNVYKRNNMANLVRGMIQRDVPVNTVGLQMHISIFQPPLSEIRQTIELFASLGVNVIITEMSISIYNNDRDPAREVTPAMLLQQAQRYRDIWNLFREQVERGNLSNMVFVERMTDDRSNRVPGRTDAPLLFDSQLQAKPAFWALVDPSRVPGLRY
jgi:endo-1,4-beta-xylanase